MSYHPYGDKRENERRGRGGREMDSLNQIASWVTFLYLPLFTGKSLTMSTFLKHYNIVA